MIDEEFKNLEVGKTFKMGNKTLKVKESDINECSGCFFYENRLDCEDVLKNKAPACASWARKDKKSIVFVEVQEKEKKTLLEEICATVGVVTLPKK